MNQSVRLKDIAEALGISETTVSRALSSKGRVSESTRAKVNEYISASGYRPNMLAKGLAQNKAFSICALLPADAYVSQLPFFQNCLMGICERAELSDYSTMVSSVSGGDSNKIEKIISMGKVDGFILMRSLTDDPNQAVLKQSGIPFVLVGSSDDEEIACVDANNEAMCRELTQDVLRCGFSRPCIILGDMQHRVNNQRRKGFDSTVRDFKTSLILERTNVLGMSDVNACLNEALEKGCDVIFCGDDEICCWVLRSLRQIGRQLPVVSFYGSELLDMIGGVYSTVHSDAHSLGRAAAEKLLNIIDEY